MNNPGSKLWLRDKNQIFLKQEGWGELLIVVIGIAISVFHLYTSAFGTLLAHKQRLIHLTAMLILTFLIYNFKGKKRNGKLCVSGFILMLVFGGILYYTFSDYSTMIMRVGNPRPLDIVIGLFYLVLVLEATRRTVGAPLVIIAVVFVAYCFVGPYIPGIFGHRGINLARLADHMFMSTEGIFGSPLGVSATYIYVFVLFGAFLEITRAGDLFIDLAVSATGKGVGGPAKAAVLSSALMGTISGSSIANVVATGTFTIPLMKKAGYKSEFAGAVEAAASTGGQIMPPVMGAAAFMMIEYTRTSYTDIMLAAIFPAIVYFASVYISVHFEAKRLGLKGISKEDMPKIREIMKKQGHLLIPMLIMIVMLVQGQTPMKAAVWSSVALIILSLAVPATRFNLFLILAALKNSAIGMIPVATACATAGIVSGCISVTGVGLKLASYIELFADGNLLIALLLTMITALILGMGLPTAATYVVLITIVGPALTNMGVPILAAHLFVFYYGVIADITPPVALAAYAASGIAESNTFRTGVAATCIAAGGFIIPYVFAYAPQMLLSIHDGLLNGLAASLPVFISALIGVTMLCASIIGYLRQPCTWYERVFLAVGAVTLIIPGTLTDLTGLAVLLLVYTMQSLRIKKQIQGDA